MNKNKKGFTLIELLAVIAVLGLVLTIVGISIVNSFSDSKDNLAKVQEKNILETAKAYFNDNLSLFTTSTPPAEFNCSDTGSGSTISRSCTISSDILVSEGYIEQPKDLKTKNNIKYDLNLSFNIIDNNIKNIKVEIEDSEVEIDPSGANSPELAEGMIPVVYDETCESEAAADNASGCWEVADTSTAWYSYNDQKWANAVTTSVSSYRTAEKGTEIPMEDINSMWVWIPRFKYKISSNMGSSSNVTTPSQIDVIFETGISTTGVDEETYRNGITSDGTNTNYYTHPAFRDIGTIEYDSSTTSTGAWDEEITGFWVGKFETGTSTSSCNTSASDTNCLDVEPIIKPDVQSLRYQTVSAQFITSIKFAGGTFDSETGNVTFTANENNAYGLNTTSNTTDTHMMKNTEWGAVAILSQSQYGKMGNSNYTGENKEVYKNDSYNSSTSSYTGRSSGAPITTTSSKYGTYSYNDKKCGTSISECTGEKVAYKGTGASTTGTIYGIYDMSGGLAEYTMGNWKNTASSSGFTTFPPSKYYDLYQGTSSSSITKVKAILGDATWETMKWYSDKTSFIITNYPWFIRGGFYSSATATDVGIWFLNYNNGIALSYYSFHSVLIP